MRTLRAFPLENYPGIASREQVKKILGKAVKQIQIVDYKTGIEITASESQTAVILRILYRSDVKWRTGDDDLERDFFEDLF